MPDITQFKGQNISREDVIRELQRFGLEYPDPNRFRNWLDGEKYKYVLLFKDRPYPPKRILSRITNIDVAEFSGGEETNKVFRDLGFEINDKEFVKISEVPMATHRILNLHKVLSKKKQIILYGPPGTGKTFNTKKYSVRLISNGNV